MKQSDDSLDIDWIKEDKKTTDYVRQIITDTKKVIPEHWEKTLSNRAGKTSLGSFYTLKPEEIEQVLLKSNFERYEHSEIDDNCEGFITYDLHGFTGLFELESCFEENVKLEANKGGFLSCVIEFSHLAYTLLETYKVFKTEPTVLIIGEHNGEKVVFTFHAGNPVSPSRIIGRERTVTAEEAKAIGFDYAKIRITDWYNEQ